MGVKYELSASTAEMPTHVEGLGMASVPELPSLNIKEMFVIIKYWDDAVELKAFLLRVDKDKIVSQGGTVADWDALVVLGANPRDYDDVVMELTDTAWGQKILWGGWYSILGA